MHTPIARIRSAWNRLVSWIRRRWSGLTGQLPPGSQAEPTAPSTEPPAQPTRTDESPGRTGVVEVAGSTSASTGRLRLLPWVSPSRDYLTLVPQTPAGPLRLLVLVHGCRQEPHGFAQATHARALVSSGEWVVLLPDQARSANVYRCWNWFDQNCIAGGGEVAIIIEMINAVQAQYGLDRDQCFIAGMSSGAAIAAALVSHAPERFAAAAFHSGVAMGASDSALHARKALTEGPQSDVTMNLPTLGRVPALVIHGRRDEVVAEIHAHELMRQMLAINGELTPGAALPAPDRIEMLDATGTHGASLASFGQSRLMLVDALGHAWSGGDARWPYNDPQGPDATAAMRTFFERHATGVLTS